MTAVADNRNTLLESSQTGTDRSSRPGPAAPAGFAAVLLALGLTQISGYFGPRWTLIAPTTTASGLVTHTRLSSEPQPFTAVADEILAGRGVDVGGRRDASGHVGTDDSL